MPAPGCCWNSGDALLAVCGALIDGSGLCNGHWVLPLLPRPAVPRALLSDPSKGMDGRVLGLLGTAPLEASMSRKWFSVLEAGGKVSCFGMDVL